MATADEGRAGRAGWKKCSFCKRWKPLSEFHKMARSPDGHQSRCKDDVSSNSRVWYAENRSKRAAQMAAWDAGHREDKARASRVRRSRTSLSREEQDRLIRLAGECMGCGEADDLQVDHIVPLSRGGQDNLANIQILCGKCNRRKKDTAWDARARWEKRTGRIFAVD